jgi:hypothetical protein
MGESARSFSNSYRSSPTEISSAKTRINQFLEEKVKDIRGLRLSCNLRSVKDFTSTFSI